MLQPLKPLIPAAAKVFDIEPQALASKAKWRPLPQFRHLMWLVAHEHGYGSNAIAKAFRCDESTVRSSLPHAREHVQLYDWWARRKADLVDAWEEACG